jgi:hypothetical protein
MLLPGGMSVACGPVSFSPRTTLTTGCPCLFAGEGRRLAHGHGDRRAGPARRQRMIAQHQVPGHDLGQAGDGHRLAVAHAEQADPWAARPPPPPGRARPRRTPTRAAPCAVP